MALQLLHHLGASASGELVVNVDEHPAHPIVVGDLEVESLVDVALAPAHPIVVDVVLRHQHPSVLHDVHPARALDQLPSAVGDEAANILVHGGLHYPALPSLQGLLHCHGGDVPAVLWVGVHVGVKLGQVDASLGIVMQCGAVDTLQARETDARRCHTDGEFGMALPLEVILLGIRAQWLLEHPSRPASPRPVRYEGDVDEEVDGGNQVGSQGKRSLRGVIRAADVGVGEMEARGLRSTTAAGSSLGDAGGQRRSPQRSGVGPTSATHMSVGQDGGIALAYGYFKFSQDKIAMPKLLEGQYDLLTWKESIEPQLEITGLKKFVDDVVLASDEDDAKLW
ncbi:unnamed protein product [Closterium sp. NIES-53]